MSITAAHVANYILDKAKGDNILITNLKLQKVVYICFGWLSAVKDEDLFPDRIEAWKLGPVIPSLYHQFSHLSDLPITGRAKIDEKIPPPIDDPKILPNLGSVYNGYAHLNSSKLIGLYAHGKNSVV